MLESPSKQTTFADILLPRIPVLADGQNRLVKREDKRKNCVNK